MTVVAPFDFPDADVILSTDGSEYRTHSFTLKTTSGFFRTMFALPQPSASIQTPHIIPIPEPPSVLTPLLLMLHCLPLPTPVDLPIDALLDAIEKYDMPGPLSIVRLLLMTPTAIPHPLRLYAISCRFGWEEEACVASRLSLAYNLYAEEVRSMLERLQTSALLRLLDLHRTRRESLRARLDTPPFVPGHITVCANCSAAVDYHTWRELKYKIILEMDVRPLGDTVLAICSEAETCWNAKCACGRQLYDKAETVRVVGECIAGLKDSI